MEIVKGCVVDEMIKAIVFDFNGVFVASKENAIVKQICVSKGIGKWSALSNYYLTIAQFELGFLSPLAFWQKVFPALTLEEFHEYVEAEYEKRFPKNEELYSLCSALSKKYSLYCISNSNFLQGKSCRKQKLYAPFREIFLSHETGKLKPLPDAFSNFLTKTGLKADECVYIDDAVRNVLAALAIGFKAVKFNNNSELSEKLKEFGIKAE